MPTPNDRPLLTWVRLVDGRLWHVADQPAPEETACGRRAGGDGDRFPELLDDAPPTNGWVCDRCVRAIAEQAAAARQAWLQDPRRRPGDQLPGPGTDSPPDGENRAKTIPADVTPATVDDNDQEA
jgi:hypothetical protein